MNNHPPSLPLILRKNEGIIADLSVRENLIIALQAKQGIFHLLSRKQQEEYTDKYIDMLQIKTASRETPIKSLSGGNQQKVVVGKWLARNSRVVIFDEPTRGIDVGAKVEIYNLMNQLKKQGIAVMFVSSEMPEVLGIADRVIVMCDGRITGEVMAKETTQNEVLKFATEFEQKKAVG